MRLRATVAYDGTDFHGWAPQPNLRTVAGVLSDALGGVSLTVAGRTDRGVHAAANVVSFDADRAMPLAAVNAQLPDDLAVRELAEAPDGFDARADAVSRRYVYRIWTGPVPDPFRSRFRLHHPRPVDVEALRACAAELEADWEVDDSLLQFRIAADAFMRHMVRVLVGTMLDLPDPDAFRVLLEGRPRSESGRTAPPQGLVLLGIEY